MTFFRQIIPSLLTNTDYVNRIYHIELKTTDTTDTCSMFPSHIDTHLEIDRECRFRAKLYQETDDFIFSNCELSIHM